VRTNLPPASQQLLPQEREIRFLQMETNMATMYSRKQAFLRASSTGFARREREIFLAIETA